MNYQILQGDCLQTLKTLPDGCVQTCVTSPPYYGLRDYGHDGQIGLEESPEAYVVKLVEVFAEVRRVLRDDGTLWLNLGDSYGGVAGNTAMTGGKSDAARGETIFGDAMGRNKGGRSKDLLGIPWRVAFALQADGWYLRSDIIWHKPNPMPESVTDRPTKAHEYIFLLSKSREYFYDAEAIREPQSANSHGGNALHVRVNGHLEKRAALQDIRSSTLGPTAGDAGRNKRSVWTVATSPLKEAHFATYPPALIEPCILAGSKPGDTVLDPFNGAATTGLVALKHGRQYIGCELNPAYIELSHKRLLGVASQQRLLEVA